jgi:DNA-nicking Smr family endonuclease
VKSFAELADLRDALKAQAEARRVELQRAQAERERREREARVFRDAMADAAPLRPSGRVERRPEPSPAHPLQRQLDERAALAASMSDEIDIERILDTDESLSFRRETVGADVVARLRRGHWVVQGQIDLHGLRVEEARDALAAFVGASLKAGHRCLRVIHGKGLGSVGREPVLKGKVLKWLVQRDEVLALCQARPTDGGAGALIVLLRPGERKVSAPRA